MRKKQLFLLVLFLYIFLSVHSQDFRHFFMEHKFSAIKIAELFNAGNEFCQISTYSDSRLWHRVNGEVIYNDSSEITFIIGCDNGNMTVGLKAAWEPVFFYDINIIGNGQVPPSAATVKSFATYMTKRFRKDEIAWIEKKVKKKLNEMDAKELCCAFLTLQYWRTD